MSDQLRVGMIFEKTMTVTEAVAASPLRTIATGLRSLAYLTVLLRNSMVRSQARVAAALS